MTKEIWSIAWKMLSSKERKLALMVLVISVLGGDRPGSYGRLHHAFHDLPVRSCWNV